MSAKGATGTVTFDGRFITITRSRLLGRLAVGKGEKRIPVKSVTAVEWKPPGVAMRGFIQFTLAGGIERRSTGRPRRVGDIGGRAREAARDENSVVFGRGQLEDFQRIRSAIEGAMVAD
jgi:hypothetical protein